MPLTSVTKDAAKLTLTVVADFPVPQERLWDAYGDPRQLERFWAPPAFEATPTGLRMTCVTKFSSVEAMEQSNGDGRRATRSNAPTRRSAC